MDMTRLELMRIPFATVLFLGSVFLLVTYFDNHQMGNIFNMAGAVVCICMLVYSMVLYSNLDMPLNKH